MPLNFNVSSAVRRAVGGVSRALARSMAGALAVVALGWSAPALADTAVTGKVLGFDVTGAGNLPFRVFLEGTPVLCTGGMSEGYLDDADGNYKVYVATLMMAKATGATVTLYSNVGQFNRCRISYLAVR